ncbi:hypothetical protein DXG01_013579 [Tephrocybe rancida]|nr:hypothetical protein DXG01_013579 [Tephrocybe rancida]
MSHPTEVFGREGMTVVETADGQFLFPKFLVPWIDQRASQIQAEAAMINKRRFPVGQNEFKHTEYYDVASGAIQIPPDPLFTDREIICLHSEISALAKDKGLKWMDAARELYMLEIAKLEAEAHASNAFAHLRERVDGLQREIPK